MICATANDVQRYCDRDMAQAEFYHLAGGTAAVYSARCPGREMPNEDAAALIPFGDQAGALVVADGMGGTPAGEHASRTAVRALEKALATAHRDGQMLRTAIMDGIEAANHAVQDLGGAGTTLTVVEVQDQKVRPYHVGDSMVLVTGQRGKVKLQTVSHSPVAFAVEAGLLDEVEAMNHEDRHLVSNVIGLSDMRIEVGSARKLAARDTLLLASDGLFDNLHIEEIVSLMRKGTLDVVVQSLAACARQRMTAPAEGQPSKPDDLTFIIFRLDPKTSTQ